MSLVIRANILKERHLQSQTTKFFNMQINKHKEIPFSLDVLFQTVS